MGLPSTSLLTDIAHPRSRLGHVFEVQLSLLVGQAKPSLDDLRIRNLVIKQPNVSRNGDLTIYKMMKITFPGLPASGKNTGVFLNAVGDQTSSKQQRRSNS